MTKADFKSTIQKFVIHIESLRESYPIHIQLISNKIKRLDYQIRKYLDENSFDKDENTYKIGLDEYKKIKELLGSISTQKIAYDTFTKGAVISLITQYDSFLGDIIRQIFVSNPKILNSSDRTLALNKIMEFKSIKNVKEYIVEKEIESVLRNSHIEQIKWLENKLSIPLRKDFEIWSDFIELTERRNLFAHNNGKVSDSYLHNCKNAKV